MTPHGALSKDELLALVKPGQIIYKVYSGNKGGLDAGVLHEVRCLGINPTGMYIQAVPDQRNTYFKNWYEKGWGYIFNNYFHALAYSLKLKADHGKAQSKERTGVEGAA